MATKASLFPRAGLLPVFDDNHLTMKITCLLATLLLVPSLAKATAGQARDNKSFTRSQIGARPPVASQPRAYAIQGREIIAPPWSAACMTDHGPSECGEHMWFYGSSDALARYRNAF